MPNKDLSIRLIQKLRPVALVVAALNLLISIISWGISIDDSGTGRSAALLFLVWYITGWLWPKESPDASA
jgi:hypothetical protein